MNLFTSNSALSFLTGLPDEPQRLTRAQVIHRDNECSNLETITRLVIRALLEDAMKSSNRLIEGDSQMLSDLLMMLEKIMFHGFKSSMKSSLIALRTPDAELWSLITKIGRCSDVLKDSISCIDRLETLVTPISKIRGILRLTMMQKKLSDLFEGVTSFVNLKDYYENWAFLRQEKAIVLTGALVGVRVIECNLAIEYDILQEQPLSVELSLYVKLPTVSNESVEEKPEEKQYEKERKVLLDQNNFLEERIRQLETNLEDARRKVDKQNDKKNEISISSGIVSYRRSEDNDQQEGAEISELKNEIISLKAENEQLATKVLEHEDSLSLAQEQIGDKTKICSDLYEKLRLSEECIRKLEDDFLKLKNHYNEEQHILCQKIENMEVSNESVSKRLEEKNNADDSLREEFQKKCEQYSSTISTLEIKQKALFEAEEKIRILELELNAAKKDLQEMPFLKDENIELVSKIKSEKRRADDNERALEELGGRLSESKLRMIELTEELLPLTDAEWAKDEEAVFCNQCNEPFTFSRRKHHCRWCGQIFCATCSDCRIKLPSNPKPARVCDSCFQILQNRHQVSSP